MSFLMHRPAANPRPTAPLCGMRGPFEANCSIFASLTRRTAIVFAANSFTNSAETSPCCGGRIALCTTSCLMGRSAGHCRNGRRWRPIPVPACLRISLCSPAQSTLRRASCILAAIIFFQRASFCRRVLRNAFSILDKRLFSADVTPASSSGTRTKFLRFSPNAL